MDATSEPGWHTLMPILDSYEAVQVTLQTDKVNNVPCGTAGGVSVHFQEIEVVNRLRKDMAQETVKNYTVNYDKVWIFDKIHHEINQFCSRHTLQEVYIDKFDTLDENLAAALTDGAVKWAPGIEIVAIRVTKPKIPDGLLKNYEQIEAQKTALQIAYQTQKVTEQKAEAERTSMKIKAKADAEIEQIENERKLQKKEAERQMEDIENRIFIEKEKSKADANHYSLMKTIEAEQTQLTQQYLQKLAIQSLTQNTKLYFGESIPQFIMENISGLPHNNVDGVEIPKGKTKK